MINILYEDKYIVVLNKPAGLSVLNEGWDEKAPFMRQMLEKKYGRIWVVHRLDKTTSGVMVFARTAEAHRDLNTQFEQHKIEKIYHAVVENIPEWDEYTARHLLHTNVGRKHRTVVDANRGKPSETEFHLRREYWANNAARIEARPKTGRTHQIRVHLAALEFPIVGDTLYGAEPSEMIGRPALHAQSLSFVHPKSKEKVTFTAPHHEDFERLIVLLEEAEN